MLTKVEIRPQVGSPVEINTLVYPLQEYDPELDLPTTSLKKMGQSGHWPTFSYPGTMTVILAGEIYGSGATNALIAEDTMAKRRALQDACLPPLDQTLTTRRHGTLRVRYDDMDEDADSDFHCVVCKIGLVAGQPGKAAYLINLHCFDPYFVGVTSSDIYIA